MKRVSEKVRDLVEVCPFTHLHDFAADPGLTLAGYRFTDITSDLMARWLDKVADVRPGKGEALALAGFRGVGKSHFLFAVAAIITKPELRAGLGDAHVTAAAERLSRRHGYVASVRRGAGTSLLDELQSALAELMHVNAATLNEPLHDLLGQASSFSGDLPLVILIDTALDRGSRVARDDGPVLSEMAAAARQLGIFLGVALDDDISGADGANSSIAGNFTIDYLDQEHLYKIVDTHIFAKHASKLALLHEIYEDYRTALPGFRWSEQRFSSLYPLHPATLELAPLIRLYIHDFALLGFAAEAGVKILGRPANSLIGIDEVFDGVEDRLRAVPELLEVFEAFDKAEHAVVAKTPVRFRLQAKLILKGLLMLSLDRQGTTAAEIAAAMMIFNESDAGSTFATVTHVLESFVAALPEGIQKTEFAGGESKYCFALGSTGENDAILAEAATVVPDDIVAQMLMHHTADKFSDVDPGAEVSECTVAWRGGLRRGEIIWKSESETTRSKPDLPIDWVLRVQTNDTLAEAEEVECQTFVWRMADLTTDEIATIKRNYLLHTDDSIRSQFADGWETASNLHSIAVERIWQRVFLDDGSIRAHGNTYRFAQDAVATHTLTALLSAALAPIFERQFPDHPDFGATLDVRQSCGLIECFFSGSDGKTLEMQNLAAAFASPLGLAFKEGTEYVPCSLEMLWSTELIKCSFAGWGTDSESPLAIPGIRRRLQAAPFGLTHEAENLVLAAMVAQRQFEFVTASGDRISHRSLDLQIVWDDIVGLAVPAEDLYSPERLVFWARLITGNPGIRRLERGEDRIAIENSLTKWLDDWRERQTLDQFDALPDENLNAAIWRTAAVLRKSFGGMAAAIDRLVRNGESLEICLRAIADCFADSETEYEKKVDELGALTDYIAAVERDGSIKRFIAISQVTDDRAIERLRVHILDTLCSAGHGGNDHDLGSVWDEFNTLYSDHYWGKHETLMQSVASGQALDAVLRSDEWTAFQTMSVHPWFERTYLARAKELVREMRNIKCPVEVRTPLSSRPYCSCGLSLTDLDRSMALPPRIHATLGQGNEYFRLRLLDNGEALVEVLEGMAAANDARTALIEKLAEFTRSGRVPQFTSHEIQLLSRAAEAVGDIGSEGTESVDSDSRWQAGPTNTEMYANVEG